MKRYGTGSTDVSVEMICLLDKQKNELKSALINVMFGKDIGLEHQKEKTRRVAWRGNMNIGQGWSRVG